MQLLDEDGKLLHPDTGGETSLHILTIGHQGVALVEHKRSLIEQTGEWKVRVSYRGLRRIETGPLFAY